MNGIPDCRKSESAPIVNLPIGIEKKCRHCEEIKPRNKFYPESRNKDGLRSYCKKCCADLAAVFKSENPDKKREYGREFYRRNASEIRAHQKQRRHDKDPIIVEKDARRRRNCKRQIAANFKKYRLSHPEETLIRAREWREKNPDKVRAAGLRHYIKKQANPKKKLSNIISGDIRLSIKKGSKNKRRWETLVGYSLLQLMEHLERQFSNGMTWKNHGTFWHIDHIIPIAVFNFNTPEDYDFKRCWALKNLQPLEAMENIRKSDKLTEPFQPSLMV